MKLLSSRIFKLITVFFLIITCLSSSLVVYAVDNTIDSEVSSSDVSSSEVLTETSEDEPVTEETTTEVTTTEETTTEETTTEETTTEEIQTEEETGVQTATIEPMSIDITAGTDVTTWPEFRAALLDASVLQINLSNDLTFDGTNTINTPVKRSLIINGNGYTLNLLGQQILLGVPADTTIDNVIEVCNITLSNNTGYIVNGQSPAIAGQWKYRFGDVTINKGTTYHLAYADDALITFYGKNYINTYDENAHVGSVIFEPGTEYYGYVNGADVSVFYFEDSPTSGTTAYASGNVFEVGEGATVRLSNSAMTNPGTTYPCVYLYYNEIIIDENANYYANMGGNAVRFNYARSSFTAKKGSVVNLTGSRTNSGSPVVNFETSNSTFKIEEGASLFIVSSATVTLVRLQNSGNKFILDKPYQYDIRNTATGTNSYAINLIAAGNSISITNSDVDLWNMGASLSGSSSASYAQVESLSVVSTSGTAQTITSSDSDLQSNFSKTTLYRRITGLNSNPDVLFSGKAYTDGIVVTDADKSIITRVRIGVTPDDNGSDENGNFNYIDVFAGLNQAQVTLTSSDSSVSYTSLDTDDDGYVTYPLTDFLKAGTVLTASAVRGGWIGSDSEITVIDVTPPEPAKVNGNVGPGQTSIKGINGEAGATVSYTINGVEAARDDGTAISTTVNTDGTWEIDVPSSGLATDDVLQIFLTDTIGNTNPTVDTVYHDATFEAATTITVIYTGALTFTSAPAAIDFGQLKISPLDKVHGVNSIDQKLTITDTRVTKANWRITATLTSALFNNSQNSTLTDALVYYDSSGNENVLGSAEAVIYEHTAGTADEEIDVSDSWDGENGLLLKVGAGTARVGTYEATITWVLGDVPSN